MTVPSNPGMPGGERSSGAPVVRLAGADDVDALVDTIGSAMADYAWTRWTLPADGYAERLRSVQRLYLERLALPHGHTWTTVDHRAVAAFVPTAVPELPTTVAARLADLHGDRWRAVLEAEEQLARVRPDCDWILACVAVRPESQRSGLGAAVVSAGLAHLDALGTTCLVETSSEANLRFYSRLGWRLVTSVVVGDGPVVHILVRDPSG